MKKKNYIKPQVRLFPVRIHVMQGSETVQKVQYYTGDVGINFSKEEYDVDYRQVGEAGFIEDDEY